MQRHHFFKIKTVNLDPDLFIQEVQPSSKLTTPIIRTLTHRRDREREKHKIISQEAEMMTTRSRSKNKEKESEEKKDVHGFDFVFSEFDTHFLQREIKSKHSNHSGFPIKRHETFKRYNHSHTNSVEHKTNDLLLYEWLPEDKRPLTDNKKAEPDTTKVDPYTKNQYVYMKNRKNDQIMQLKRSMKMQKVNSIVKSYRIATMNLNPPSGRRSSSVKMSNVQRRKQSDNFNKIAAVKKESQIKPWDWSHAEDSKEYL